MGANVSSTYQKTTQKLQSTLSNNCKPNTNVRQVISDINFTLGGQASCGIIRFQNKARATATCNLDSTAQMLAEAMNNLTEKQKAGLGINVSNSQAINKATILTRLNNACGSASAVEQNIKGINFNIIDQASCDLLEFMNDADATSVCVSNLVNQAFSKLENTAVKSQLGFDPTAIFGFIMVIVLVVGIIFLVVKFGGGGSSRPPPQRYYRPPQVQMGRPPQYPVQMGRPPRGYY